MELLERENALSRLGDQLADARAGKGGFVVVQGEAGIGKTSLVGSFVASLEGEAFVLWGACDDLSTPRPLGPFRDMANEDADIATALGDGDRFVLFRTLLELCSRSLRPTVLVLEDVHWADDATLDVVRFVARRINATHGLMILTARSALSLRDPWRVAMGGLATHGLQTIDLEPLSLESVEALTTEPATAHRVWEVSSGNPFFVSELLRSREGEVPDSVRGVVAAQLEQLDDRSRRLVETVSVVPTRLELRILDAIDPDLRAGIDPAAFRGIIAVRENSIEFRHELTRSAVESELAEMRRRDLHRMVMEAFEALGEDPSRAAHHALGARDPDAMVRLLPTAARAAADVASFREALSHLMALEPYLDRLTLDDRADLLELRLAMEFRSTSGDLELAERVIELRHALGDPTRLGLSLLSASRIAHFGNRRSRAIRWAEESVSVLQPVGGEPLARAYAELSRLFMVAHDNVAAMRYAEEALKLASEGSYACANALLSAGTAIATMRYPEGVEMIRRSHEIFHDLGSYLDRGRARNNLAAVALLWRDLDTAEEWYAPLADLDPTESPAFEFTQRSELADLQFRRGNWTRAEELSRSVLDSTIAAEYARARASWVYARVLVRTGASQAAGVVAEAWDLAGASGELQYAVPMAETTAEYLWLADETETELMEKCLAVLEQVRSLGMPWYVGDVSLWLWLGGHLEAIPEEAPDPILAMGRGEWAEAADWFDDRDLPYERSVALSLGGIGAQLEALETLDRLGAKPLAAVVRARLRAEGVEGIPRGPTRASASHPLGLTPRQAEVLGLLGESLTNAEIADRLYISSRTVEKHVAAVLVKLGVGTRMEAATKAWEVSADSDA